MNHLLNSTGYPLYNSQIVNSSGCFVFDHSGKKYADFEAGVWCLALGHNHPRLNTAIQEQLTKICHVGYNYNAPVAEQAADKLIEIVGFSDGKCVFLSSGSEAVEFGIQVAKILRSGKKCISLANQYLSAYGAGADMQRTSECVIPWEDCSDKSVDQWCTQLLAQIDFEQVGVFVFEAGNSSGLVKLPPQNLVSALNILTKQYNILTVVDEVTCGIGRTGKWFGYMHYDLAPDIISLGKALGNGYPVSAVVLKDQIAADVLKAGFHYAQSHQNDPLGCRIALEVINIIEQEHLLKRAETVGSYLREGYAKLQQKFPIISEVKGVGLLNSIRFSDDVLPVQLEALDKQLFDAGFIVGMKPKQKTLRTYLPLIADVAMIDTYFSVLHQCLESLFIR